MNKFKKIGIAISLGFAMLGGIWLASPSQAAGCNSLTLYTVVHILCQNCKQHTAVQKLKNYTKSGTLPRPWFKVAQTCVKV